MYRCFNTILCVFLLLPAVLFAQGRFMEDFQDGNGDIVILNENLLEIPFEKILETQVDMTILDGEIVYRQTGNQSPE